MPEINYIGCDGKLHSYYPDLFIKSKNMIVEVKSMWTYNKDKEKNLLKKEACLSMGYLFEFRIYDGKGKMINIF
jgi:hypothetical protein